MSLARKVLFNTSAQFLGKIANTILGLFSVAIITRYLGVSGYGDYTTAFAYIMFFSVVSDFGFFWVIVRKISIGEKVDRVIRSAQTLRLIFALAVFAGAIMLVGILPYSSELKTAVVMVAISIFWMGQNSVYLALFQAKLRMDRPVIAETISRFISVALVLLAVKLGLGFLWIVAAGLSATLFNYIFNLVFSLRYSRFGFGRDWQMMGSILKEALPIGIVTILSLIYFKIDTILLSVMKESVDVGIYGTAYKVLEILAALPIMFVGTVFPAISKAFGDKDIDRLQILLQKSFNILSIGSFGIMAFFLGFARPTIRLIAGDEFLQTATVYVSGRPISSDIVLQVLVIAVGISFWSTLFTNSLITFNKQGKLIMPYIIATVFNVGANILLIPRYSYLAAALSTVVTEIIILAFTYSLVKKLANIHLAKRTLVVSALAGSVALALGLLAGKLNVFLAGALIGISYIAILYIGGAIPKQAISGLIKMSRK